MKHPLLLILASFIFASGKLEARDVTAEVWTEAFQADVDADGRLHIPAREKPYYLDRPLVMKSGNAAG